MTSTTRNLAHRAGSTMTVLALIGGVAIGIGASPVFASTSFPVTNTITVGARPQWVAIDPVTGSAFVANEGSASVSVIDEATGTVTHTITVGTAPQSVAVDPLTGTVFVANRGGSVSVISEATDQVTATISLSGYIVQAIAVDPATGEVFVADTFQDSGANYGTTVSVIDESTDTVTGTITVGSAPVGLAVDSSTGTVFVTSGNDDSVSVIDESTGLVTDTIHVDGYPQYLAVDESTETVYVGELLGHAVATIDEATSTVTDTIGVGAGAFGVAADESTNLVYVSLQDDSVSVIDGSGDASNDTVIANVSLAPLFAVGVAVDQARHAAYLADYREDTDPFPTNGTTVTVITEMSSSQAITFTSTAPSGETVGGPDYTVSATGGDSGNPVTFTVDSGSTSVCSIEGAVVSFIGQGDCVIDAHQAGTANYFPADEAQQTIPVELVGTSVQLSASVDPSVFGQHVTATASVSPQVAGSVQFTVGGVDLGSPVDVSDGQATSPTLTESGASPAPGQVDVAAEFTPTDGTTYASSNTDTTFMVNQAATTTHLDVTAHSLTATVTAVAPGAGTPTGTVSFAVGGSTVGTAPLSGGVATLSYETQSAKTLHVSAFYAGDGDFTGSSVSTARHNPTIKARLSSRSPKSRSGWYRTPVKVTFTCTSHGAPDTADCPAPVTLSKNKAAQAVTAAIGVSDGGIASVAVRGINIDRIAPTVRVGGVHNGAVYSGPAPTLTCVGHDALSGVASCTRHAHGGDGLTHYVLTATDKAGNTATVRGSYGRSRFVVDGVPWRHGAFTVHRGHRYLVTVIAATRPRYYDATPATGGQPTPFRPGVMMHAAGPETWTIRITMTAKMRHYAYWNIGAMVGHQLHVVKLRVLP